jgi:rhodanese-related sulfurtransferase
MKPFVNALFGGAALMVIASLVGVAQNALRTHPVKLIQTVQAVAPEKARSGDPSGEADLSDAGEGAEVEGVSTEEMLRMIQEGLTVVIDARGPSEYENGHLPGAINIPYEKLPEMLDKLQTEAPIGVPVVCYCRGPLCDLSDSLADELRFMGYQNVQVYKGGWEHWTEAGHETVEGTSP